MHFLIKSIQNPMRHEEVWCAVQDHKKSGGTETRARVSVYCKCIYHPTLQKNLLQQEESCFSLDTLRH